MNILVPDLWLRDFIKTKATPSEIARYLSLSGQSVERIKKEGKDTIYDIEVTTNRPDCLSVYGIARELKAILPRFGIEATLATIPEKLDLGKIKESLPLKVKIEKSSLCPRFTALIFDNITIKPSPKVVQDRLKKSGIRALNNVIDISNYLMLEVGQPMHTFDYDKIAGATMILRNSKKGEKLITLDGVERKLPEGTIVIEDGEGRLIDLCGIMGGQNSEVDGQTKRVLLFIQTYDPLKIRRACQTLGFRTEAASRFEKGLDPEGVIPAMAQAVKMFKEAAGARVASNLIDIYPNPPKTKKVSLSKDKLEEVLGTPFSLSQAKIILEDLGFGVKIKKSILEATVPHFRNGDVSIPEDLIEEIARIYGYHKIPTVIPFGQPPKGLKKAPFPWEDKAKDMLAHWGFTEIASYSMVSEELLIKTGFYPRDFLEISNPLSLDLVYMRPSLIPSLLTVIKQNQPLEEKIKVFEMANIYLPEGLNKLPDEKMRLVGMLSGNLFYEAKGVIEELLDKFGIKKVAFKPFVGKNILYHPTRAAVVETPNKTLGTVGEINPEVLKSLEITGQVSFFDLDFETIVTLASTAKTYRPILEFPPIIEDLAFEVKPKTPVGDLLEKIKKTSALVQEVHLLDAFEDTRTFRITYQSPKKTLTDKEVKKVREEVVKRLAKKFGVRIKS